MMARRIGLVVGILVVFFVGIGVGVLAQGETRPEVAQVREVVNGVGTAFTYQGVLTDGGNPADGVYDLQIRLYDAAMGGNQIGSVVTLNDQPVSEGLLAVSLDFGEQVFGGSPRWLAISVRPGSSSGNYETLAARQPLTASPYAIHSGTAQALAAEMLPPTMITVTATGGGSLSQGSYFFKIVASDGLGTSVGSAEVTCAVNGSSTNRCALTWETVPGAAAYRIYKGAASNGQNLYQTSTSDNYNYDTDSGSMAGLVPTTSTAFVSHINSSGDSWLLGGNLGIGTTNPEATLHLDGDGVTLYGPNSGWDGYLQVGGSGYYGDRASISTSDGTLYLDDKDGGSGTFINFYSQNNTLLNAQGGNVGIGTNNPTAQLHLAGDGRLHLSDQNSNITWEINNAGNTSGLRFTDATNGINRLTIASDGEVSIGTSINPSAQLQVGSSGDGTLALANAWNTFSDERYKTDIMELENASELLTQLEGVHFTWKGSGEESIGFIAQDVQSVLPELVQADEAGYLSLDYARIAPVLVESLKEQQEMIDAQQMTIDRLQRQNSNLANDVAEIKASLLQEPVNVVSGGVLKGAPIGGSSLGLLLLVGLGLVLYQSRRKR